MNDKQYAASIAGKNALVVGGSGGLGLAIARALAGADVSLTIHGRDAERVRRAAQACRDLSPSSRPVDAIVADLSSGIVAADLEKAAARSDLLVVAYGPFVYKNLGATTPEDWRLMALAGLAVPGILAGTAAAAMGGRGFGRILLFGGTRTDAVRGYKANAAYAAAKTGLGVVAKSVAAEFAGRGVSCAVLCPGFVDTEYLEAETRKNLAARSPRGSLIDPASIAVLGLFLLEGGMDLANGAVINADEGLYAL